MCKDHEHYYECQKFLRKINHDTSLPQRVTLFLPKLQRINEMTCEFNPNDHPTLQSYFLPDDFLKFRLDCEIHGIVSMKE